MATPSVCELTLTIKDFEKTMREKFLVYDAFQFSADDPIIKDCIAKALANFNGEPESIKIRASLLVL